MGSFYYYYLIAARKDNFLGRLIPSGAAVGHEKFVTLRAAAACPSPNNAKVKKSFQQQILAAVWHSQQEWGQEINTLLILIFNWQNVTQISRINWSRMNINFDSTLLRHFLFHRNLIILIESIYTLDIYFSSFSSHFSVAFSFAFQVNSVSDSDVLVFREMRWQERT